MKESKSFFRYQNVPVCMLLLLLVGCGTQIPYVNLKKYSPDKPTIVDEEGDANTSDAKPLQLDAELFSLDPEPEVNKGRERVSESSNPAVASLSELANHAVSKKDWEKAKSALERALKIAPGDASVWRRLAYCYHQTGNHQQALAQAQRASSLSPNNTRDRILNRELIGLIIDELESSGMKYSK
jgi:tetratricopeptide (TPR) repeat protein